MKKRLIGAVALTAIVVISCQKFQNESTGDLSADLTGVVSDVISSQVYEASVADVQSLAVEKFDGTTKAFSFDGFNPKLGFGKGFGHFAPVKFGIPHISDCATVTVSSSTFPKTITVDYGTACSEGKRHVKSGKIIIEMSDTVVNAGAIQTIKYENFYIDSMKVDLTATRKNLGKNASGNWVVETSWEQIVTQSDGDIIVQKNSESIEWVSGFETTDKADDVYYKTGAGTITVNNTLKFSRTITTALLYDKSCGYIKSGKVELNRDGSVTVIDYGDGTCDSSATVTANDTTEVIDLTKGKFGEGGKFQKHMHKGRH